jgi:hypothetical protein
VWFRRGRLFIVSPDSLGTACPLSGRNSTYRPVQILEAGSKQTLIDEIAAWENGRNAHHTKANWHFTTPNARIKLKHLYPSMARRQAGADRAPALRPRRQFKRANKGCASSKPMPAASSMTLALRWPRKGLCWKIFGSRDRSAPALAYRAPS